MDGRSDEPAPRRGALGAPTRRRLLAGSGAAAAALVSVGLASSDDASGSSSPVDWPNVKADFGAKGDGLADDTRSLMNAISAVAPSGGVVYVPPGTYEVTDELVLPNSASNGPNIVLIGAGRNATVLRWQRDLGPGHYAIRTDDLDGVSIAHRVRDLQLSGPLWAGLPLGAPGMDGLCLSSGGGAEEVWTQGFRAGLVVRNGLQRYASVQSSNNQYNLYLINAIGTGDVTLDDIDLTGSHVASMAVHGISGEPSGINFRHVHFGFAPTGILFEDSPHPGLSFSDFLECGYEACGNYLFYAPSPAAGVVGCTFIENGVASYGLSTYYEPTIGQISPICLSGGVWGGNTVLGSDSLSALTAGNTCYLNAASVYQSSWDSNPRLLDALRTLGKPFARGVSRSPAGVEFRDGSARMRIRSASVAVTQDTVVQPDSGGQVKPLASAGGAPAVAEGVAKLAAMPGDCTAVAFEGRTDVALDGSCQAGEPLAPSPANVDHVAAADIAAIGTAGGGHNWLGWAAESASGGTVAIFLRPTFIPAFVSSGVVTLSRGTSGAIANTQITQNTLMRLTNTNASGAVGALSVTLTPGSGFTINSTSGSDNSKVFWEVVQY